MNSRIQQYRFSDSKAGVITTAAIHLVCGFLLIMVAKEVFLSFGRGQFCLIIAIILALLYRFYDWKDTITNIVMIGAYILGLITEWSLFGIPEAPMTMTAEGYGKGFATTFIMQMMPWFYTGLRVLCVLLLVHITREAYQLRDAV